MNEYAIFAVATSKIGYRAAAFSAKYVTGIPGRLLLTDVLWLDDSCAALPAIYLDKRVYLPLAGEEEHLTTTTITMGRGVAEVARSPRDVEGESMGVRLATSALMEARERTELARGRSGKLS